MKTYLFLLAMMAAGFSYAQPQKRNAQIREEKKEQLAAQKAAYITARTGMTSEQAEKFWPVYNRFQDELEENRLVLAKQTWQRPALEERTDAELMDLMDQRFKMEEQKLKIEMKYHKEFLKLLSVKQLAKLYKAQEDFKREVLREIKARR